MRIFIPILAAVGALLCVAPASAKDTVECLSKSYKYNECNARTLEKPVLIYQSSDADCIMNRTWGYSSRDNYIWVDRGCSGVFADSNGYHHGKTNTYDRGARSYDRSTRSYDSSGERANRIRDLYDEGYTAPSDYDGCHGIGCLVDNPDD